MDSFVLQTSDSDIQNGEFLGRLGFAANEADTGDARAISAVVSAMAEAPFTSTSNPTSIVFATAFDGDTTNKLRITSSGNLLPFVSGIYDIGSVALPFRKVFTDELRVGDYNFPTSDGTSGYVLSTDGQGQLSFVSVASSAGDNYVDSVSFDPSNNKLTLGRTGSLIDLFTTISFTDTNTTYTAGSGLFLDSSNEFHANVSGIQSVASNSTTSTASRTYAIQIDPNDQLVVNVPWVDTDTDTDTDTNDHLDDVVWNDTTGDLTFSFTGPSSLSNIVENLDGRYHHIITNPVSGVGSADYVARWLDVSTLGTGILYDDGSKVGIGTSTPAFKLDVNGNFSANSVNVNSAFTFPTVDGSAGQVLKTDGFGNVSWGIATDNVVSSASFDTGNGVLSLGRTGGLTDVTVDLDGRFSLTDTTYVDGTGLSLVGTTFHANVDATVQTVSHNAITSTAGRTYAVQVDGNDDLVMNVPWVDTDTNNYVDSAAFDTSNGVLTLSRLGLNNVTVDLDGRYQPTLTNPVTGTGASNYAARWTSSTVLGTGIIYDNGSNVGIGTITPNEKLHVSGGDLLVDSIRPVTISTASNIVTSKKANAGGWEFSHDAIGSAGTNSGGYGWYGTDDVLSRYWIGPAYDTASFNILYSNGNVGINILNPAYDLDLAGTARIEPTTSHGMLIGRGSGASSIRATGADAQSGYLILDSNGQYMSLNHYTSDNIVMAYGGGKVGLKNYTPACRLAIGENIPGVSNVGISVDMGGVNTPSFTTRRGSGNPVFSILPYTSQVYISAGVFYNGSQWVHSSDNVHNCVFTLDPGNGALWYAGNNGSSMSNVASAEPLWASEGWWRNLWRTTKTEPNYAMGSLSLGDTNRVNSSMLHLKQDYSTAGGTTSVNTQYVDIDINSTSDLTNYTIGINIDARKDVSDTRTDSGYIMGADFNAALDGTSTGTLQASYGIRTFAGIRDAGTVNNAYGVYSRVLNLGTGTINNGYGVYINNVNATNSYGLYQSGTDDKNYFAGSVGVGFSTPSENLETANSIGILNGWKIYQGTVNISGGGTANGASVILNNEHLATLNTTWHYIVRLNTTGTGTDTGSSYLVWYSQDTTTWIARMISRSGDFSNHPLLYINSSNAVIYNNHTGAYDVNYVVESYFAGVDDATAHSMGANFHWQRDVDDLSYSDGTVTASEFIGENYIDKHSAVTLSVGWYTVATNKGSGQNGRATARFGLANESGGRHQGIIFYASHHYGAGNKITILHNDCYNVNNKPISKIRIKEGGVYDGCLLQVYIDDSTNQVQVKLLDDNINKLLGDADAGWKIVDWVADATDPGTVANFSNITNVASEVNLDDFDFGSTGDIHGKSFVKSGGTPSEFLKADGSIDNSTYLTSYTETDPIFGAHTVSNIVNGTGFLKNNGAGTWTYDNSTYLTSVTFSDIAAAAIVTEAEGISSNDNDTTLPTSAAVKDYVDSNTGGGGNNVVRGTVSATNGQTSFSVGGGYTVGAIDVYLNGVKLINGTDFTATDTSAPYNIVLTSAAQSGDTLEYVAFDRATTAGTLQDTGDTMTGNLTVNADLIVTGYKETHTDNGNTGTAQTIDISDSTLQTYTLNGNCTFTMPTADAGRSFTMFLKTGAGSLTATFTGVKFPSNTAPTITTTASRMDIITFYSDGTNWYGSIQQEYHV